MQADSHLELNHLFLLNARREIADLREQVRFRFGAHDEHEHIFDLFATLISGRTIAFTVKPEARLASGRFIDEMQVVAWWVRKKKFADEVRLLTDADLDTAELHNAKIFAAVREEDPDADLKARTIAAELVGAVSLRKGAWIPRSASVDALWRALRRSY